MTKKWLLSSATALALITTPALAQKDSASSGSPKSQQETNNAVDKALSERNAASGNQASQSGNQASPGNNAGQSASNQSAGTPHRNVRAMTQQRMRTALEEAGFTQIRVLDAKYLIQAKDDSGNTVFMSINPPSTDRAAMSRAETTGSGSGDGRSGSPRSNINDFTDSANSSGSSAGSGPWNSQRVYNNSAYDQGFRDGYNRGYDNGAGYGYSR